MSWNNVGDWLKDNAGTGASLVGSLLTGNVAGAISAGVSLVSGATGTDNPELALQQLTTNPESMVKLKELYYKNEDSVRKHIEAMHLAELEDKQKEQETTAKVIVEGQRVAQGWFEKNSRPLMAWFSMLFSGYYVAQGNADFALLGIVIAPCFAWMGLRTIDKRSGKINPD